MFFFWPKYLFYLEKKKETELKIKQIKKDLSETDRFCKEINHIYLKNKKIQLQPNPNNNDIGNNNESKHSSKQNVL